MPWGEGGALRSKGPLMGTAVPSKFAKAQGSFDGRVIEGAMRTKLLFAAMLVVTIAALGVGWYEHGRAQRAERAAAAAKAAPKVAAKDCSKDNFASLTRAVSTLVDAKQQSVAAPETAKTGDDDARGIDDLSSEEQAQLFEASDKLGDSSKQGLAELVAKLRLSSEQEQALRDHVARMNERAARSLDKLVTMMTQDGPVRPREAIDVLAEGLDAVREADDAFRASLDEGQRKLLEAESFDMTSAIDPSLLLPSILALATASD